MKRLPIAAALTAAALTATLAGPASAAHTPAGPDAMFGTAVWCAHPHTPGAVCLRARGIAVLAGFWGTRGGVLRLERVPGRFEGSPLGQLHITGRPGKCVGSNPANTTAMVVPCYGRAATGSVFAVRGIQLVSRYWTLAMRSPGVDPNWVLTASRRGNLLRYRLDGSTRASQFWGPCSQADCAPSSQPA